MAKATNINVATDDEDDHALLRLRKDPDERLVMWGIAYPAAIRLHACACSASASPCVLL
jgi:hypothetical protein